MTHMDPGYSPYQPSQILQDLACERAVSMGMVKPYVPFPT